MFSLVDIPIGVTIIVISYFMIKLLQSLIKVTIMHCFPTFYKKVRDEINSQPSHNVTITSVRTMKETK